MVTASFRFHGKLNAFLRRSYRHCEFSCLCAQSATTKHMVEALGVPHTEVGSLFVNDESSGFNHLLRHGDRVVIYPVGRAQDTGSHLDIKREQINLRFIADSHLGGVARLLRMAGFDTLYDNHYRDETIALLSRQESRIVLTRDRELLKRSELERGCYIRALIPKEQLREIAERFSIAAAARPFTRCLHCNVPLHAVSKETVLERLPPSVRENQDKFKSCNCCHRIYWQGSHWQRMHTFLETILRNEGK